jgi:hypothetical protein
MRRWRLAASAAIGIGVLFGSVSLAPAADAVVTQQRTYLNTSPVLLQWTLLGLPQGELPLGVPLPVTKLEARLSLQDGRFAYLSGIEGQDLVWFFDDVEVCRGTTNEAGRATCTITPQQELLLITGNHRLQVGYFATPEYRQAAEDVPLIGRQLEPDPGPFPL